MTTGERIKTARKKAGLTQKELGQKLGLSFQSIAQWENDLRNPKFETLRRIAAALNVHELDLLGVDNLLSNYRFEVEEKGSERPDDAKKILLTAKEVYDSLPLEAKSEFFARAFPDILTEDELIMLIAYRHACGDDREAVNLILRKYIPGFSKQNSADAN